MNYSNFVYTERLRRERFAKKITMREMAELLGYKSPTSYMNIENGKVCPKLDKMIEIADLLGKPVEYFFNIKVQDSRTNKETAIT
jgi:transcriptional regulator with XRE-family HTH domain